MAKDSTPLPTGKQLPRILSPFFRQEILSKCREARRSLSAVPLTGVELVLNYWYVLLRANMQQKLRIPAHSEAHSLS